MGLFTLVLLNTNKKERLCRQKAVWSQDGKEHEETEMEKKKPKFMLDDSFEVERE